MLDFDIVKFHSKSLYDKKDLIFYDLILKPKNTKKCFRTKKTENFSLTINTIYNIQLFNSNILKQVS
jgi:hypothetical protein